MVFVGPYEHHSSLLPWRESGATVVRIRETAQGLLDLSHLDQELQVTIMTILYTICSSACIGSRLLSLGMYH